MNDCDAWRNWLRTFSVVSKSPLCASRTYIRRISAKLPFMCANIRRNRLSYMYAKYVVCAKINMYARRFGWAHARGKEDRVSKFQFRYFTGNDKYDQVQESMGEFKCGCFFNFSISNVLVFHVGEGNFSVSWAWVNVEKKFRCCSGKIRSKQCTHRSQQPTLINWYEFNSQMFC